MCEEARKLRELTEDLVMQVKSDIDVPNEGHGNAIRVLTLVTLFSLPLSVKHLGPVCYYTSLDPSCY